MLAEREIRILIESVTYEVEESLFGLEEGEGSFSGEDIAAALEPEKMEIRTIGVMRNDGCRAEISYEESEATGMEGSVTSVSFDTEDRGIVTMIRTGIVSATLVFEKGKRHHCIYKTPYMPFEVCVKTVDVKNELNAGGALYLDYVVEIRGAKAERNKFTMRIMD